MERRGFLRLASATFAAALLDYPLALAAASQSTAPVVLAISEWQLLDAICARILPPVSGVSTADAGCVNFIDKLLAHEEQALAPAYRAALAALAAVARAERSGDFTLLGATEQDESLAMLEDGVLEHWPDTALPQQQFFALLRWHTLLGFLADPRYGGNRDGSGWRAIGHEGHLHAHGGISDEQLAGLVTGGAVTQP